jgi:hypothetical protein
MAALRDTWEATSFALEARQANPACVAQEAAGLATRAPPAWRLTYAPAPTPDALLARPPGAKPRVAVLREEGTNGDREMAAVLLLAFVFVTPFSPRWLVTKGRVDEARAGAPIPEGECRWTELEIEFLATVPHEARDRAAGELSAWFAAQPGVTVGGESKVDRAARLLSISL